MCRPNERTHKHHIIPKYMGGSNEPENLVEVTLTQHTMFHFCNYQLWGNEEDFIAWRGLSNQIDLDQIKLEAMVLGAKKAGQKNKENGTGFFKLTVEQRNEHNRKAGQKSYEKETGVHNLTPEQRTKNGKKGGQKAYEQKVGIHNLSSEQLSENGKKGGKLVGQKNYELGLGIHGRTKEKMSEDGKKAAKKCEEIGVGVYGLTFEQRSEAGKKGGPIGGKKTAAQRWQCTETGFVSTASGLANYQKKRGINTSNRIRIK